jgi:uncharacterized iron-regulated membrane protein
LIADAPDPAYCPHHHCDYTVHHLSSGGVTAIAIVVIILGILIALIATGLLFRRPRRRGRSATAGQ